MKDFLKRPFAAYLLAGLFAFLLYANTIYNEYNVDDFYVADGNQQIAKGFGGIKEIFATNYGEYAGEKFEYRPIVKATFAIEYQFFGFNPYVSHAINALLFALLSVLLLYFFKLLLANYNPLIPILAVLLFIAHPIHTEVVASLKNRDELLSFLFALLTALFIYKGALNKKPLLYGVAFLLFILAMLSKQSAFVFVFIVPLVLYYFTNARLLTIGAIGLILFVIAIAEPTLADKYLADDLARTTFYIENPLYTEKDWSVRIGTSLRCMFFYDQKLIIPHPLGWYYGYNTITLIKVTNGVALLSILFHGALTVIALVGLKKKRILSFFLFSYLTCIFLFSNFIKPIAGIVAERYAFSASIFFSFIIILLLFALLKIPLEPAPKSKAPANKRNQTVLLVITCLLAIPLSVKTITRNADWKNYLTLFAKDAEYLKSSVKANYEYAYGLRFYYNNNKLEKEEKHKLVDTAIKHLRRSLKLSDTYEDANNLMGLVLMMDEHQVREAAPYIAKALNSNPYNPEYQFNMGYCNDMLGVPEAAIRHYELALGLDSAYFGAYNNLVNMHITLGNFTLAFRVNNIFVKKFPESPVPFLNYAFLHATFGDYNVGTKNIEKAYSLAPNDYSTLMDIARYYDQIGDMEKKEFYKNLASSLNK